LVASNKIDKNEIDINAVYVKNKDPRVYREKEKLEEERLALLVERHTGVMSEDGTIHAHDLISM
jgi:hypothetical protein